MSQKTTKWILSLLIGVCSVQSQTLESNEPSKTGPETPVNFRATKLATFPAYDEAFSKAYLKVGSRNLKWDADALKALKLWSYNICDENCVVAGPEFEPMVSAVRRSVDERLRRPTNSLHWCSTGRRQGVSACINAEIDQSRFSQHLPANNKRLQDSPVSRNRTNPNLRPWCRRHDGNQCGRFS